jgi:hypothetical protein
VPKYEISLEELFAPVAKPVKPKSSREQRRLPGEPRPFVARHLTSPQFLNEMGEIHSARKDKEQVRKAGPETLIVTKEINKLRKQLMFAQYSTKFVTQLLEHNHD